MSLNTKSLVLYKVRPAVITSIADKIEIMLPGGQVKKVREKDIRLLHPGPVDDIESLDAPEPNLEETWELLRGEKTTLSELSELLFGEFTPATAWNSWSLVFDGFYFEGSPSEVRARSPEEVASTREEREASQREAEEWAAFIEHIRMGELGEGDRTRLIEVERVALGEAAKSRILKELSVPQTMEDAHRFLVKCGYWDTETNPHPRRIGVSLESPSLDIGSLPDEERLDLRHLAAYAIDDEDNQDPDDAISLDGDRLWVHVADVAALVKADSELDLVAREKAANLYLPESVTTMLPPLLTDRLGLGLTEESPALSIGFRLEDGEPADVRIALTRLVVTRMSYQRVDREQPEELQAFFDLAKAYRKRRMDQGAIDLALPEVNINKIDDEIQIHPMSREGARQMVSELMLAAGEAAARLAQDHELPMPFVSQPAPEEAYTATSWSEMYAYRRLLKPGKANASAGLHAGLGLEPYVRVTSPLRRYLDLVAHQQLRRHLAGETLLTDDEINERVAAVGQSSANIRKAERLSNLHWKLVYLARHPDWQGDGVVLAIEERKVTLVIPELAMEVRIRPKDQWAHDQVLRLKVREVDLPGQVAYFQVVN